MKSTNRNETAQNAADKSKRGRNGTSRKGPSRNAATLGGSRKRTTTINLVLIVAILVALNLVSSRAFLRIDLTSDGAYSLSALSRETLARAEDPLRVRVFYTDGVPPPYSGVRQYLLDLLREYQTLGGRAFSYDVVDLSSSEGRAAAREYGLEQVEIQEVRSDEFQSRAVFLGAVVLYGSSVETVDGITGTDGLEYRLTSAMERAISRVDALAGMTEPVEMRVVLSADLERYRIQGFEELPDLLEEIFHRMNDDSYGRLTYELSRPRHDEGRLEVQFVQGDRLQTVPLHVYSGLFGGYALDDPGDIEESLRWGLRSFVAANPRVGYSRGSGERDLQDYRQGAGALALLLEDRYELVPLDLSEEEIPPDLDTLIVNGPRREYSRQALYRLDQFVMRGGRLLVFLDRYHQEMPSQQEMLLGAEPRWEQIETGLEEVLAHYGLDLTPGFVLDEESFVSSARGGRQKIYQAPVLRGGSLNRDSVITRALEDLIVLNAQEIGVPRAEDALPGRRVTRLLQSSPRSWTVDDPSLVGSWLQGVPPGETSDRRVLAALLEGEIPSFFSAPPDPPAPLEEGTLAGADSFPERFRSESLPEAAVLLVGSSELASAQLLDPRNRTPNGTFLLNALDYLKDQPGRAELRSKGLTVPRLQVVSPLLPGMIRWFNVLVVPALVVVLGLVVRGRRRARSRAVQALFSREEVSS
ncbi:hypothetical protein AU468_07080 [Alkalispirochaeta sphaeroplastigenens]|uniref:Uncharacterized protein n=1 Tax=Alkalispirochaeta sphaeroplastigenens TaxID=1187066 RepID=A0A2S4JRB1_9SPIO|nr:Gldg family protein [Alkalispirochaeta sphaeroplastigenens]POR02010.1 hypothetical protein AU468_07080 [Alkalispirochaeta sphaeroplastigenens]